MGFETTLALGIFSLAFVAILFEWAEKSVIALAGALAMIISGLLSPEEAIDHIEFETLFLLMGMMMIVDVMRRTEMFSWLNMALAKFSRGRPWLVFTLFLLITALVSAFLDSVTAVVLMIPIMISLTQGMGFNPHYYVIGIILFANIGGNLTLIGDPANILIGTSAGLSFNDFVSNLFVPIGLVTIFVLASLAMLRWKELRPISGDLRRLFLSHLLIQKIESKFRKVQIDKVFVYKTIGVFVLTILGFVFQWQLGLPIYVIALSGAALLILVTGKMSDVHHILREVEWKALLFFGSLFVMIGALDSTGILELIGKGFLHFSGSFFLLVISILWVSAMISMVLDNVPFVVIMIPVIFQIQEHLGSGVDSQVLWWALSLGAILGGCGTLVGASPNLVSANIAKKYGVEVSFLGYMKTATPLTFGMLLICTLYFYVIL